MKLKCDDCFQALLSIFNMRPSITEPEDEDDAHITVHLHGGAVQVDPRLTPLGVNA